MGHPESVFFPSSTFSALARSSHSVCVTEQIKQCMYQHPALGRLFFFCSNALIALARSLCKCLLAVLITASEADAVTGFLVRGAS